MVQLTKTINNEGPTLTLTLTEVEARALLGVLTIGGDALFKGRSYHDLKDMIVVPRDQTTESFILDARACLSKAHNIPNDIEYDNQLKDIYIDTIMKQLEAIGEWLDTGISPV